HRPGGATPGTFVQEATQHFLPVLGVEHLGVELDTEQATVAVLERRDRGVGGTGGGDTTRWGGRDGVTVRRPHELLGGHDRKQYGDGDDREVGKTGIGLGGCVRGNNQDVCLTVGNR